MPVREKDSDTQKRQKKASPKLKSANLRKGDGKGNKILPKPKDWEKFNYHETRAHFDCDEYAEDLVKPLPTLKDWEYLRSKYIEIVDNHAVFDDPVPPTDGYTFDENGSPPYYASHSERGRGLFASRNIKKEDIHNVNVKPASSVSTRFYASRDIQKGEELLYDYDVYETVWEDVGL
ncbi:hypothetical protein ACHAXA_009537 [Cyclostephanos tholiformis]|uniref:SET domain-containing protein n=1 Tax=Cyclostephanos tholiformis TaxID=382380 RepID=A0ABD3RYF4_9STRA